MLQALKRYAPAAISGFAAVVFLDSLRYKFSNAPETQVIFGKLDAWAASWGADGLFAQTGLFSQYVIGSAELVASGLLLLGLIPGLKRLNALGALLAFAVMSGAVSFHLFTPLALIAIRRHELVGLARDIGGVFVRREPQGVAYSSAHAFTR